MTVRGTWYISARAVREWMAITCQLLDPARPDDFAAGERSLLDAVARAHHVRDQDNGLSLWRGPRPYRVRLLVSHEDRPEGPLPQLVSVERASPHSAR